MTIPQTSYSLEPALAYAGMLGDNDPASMIVGEFIASEDIPYGRVVEIDPTATAGYKKVRLPATASAVGTL